MAVVSLRSPAGTRIVIAAVLASSMAFIDSTALNVALPSLQRSLGASAAGLFWVLNAYLLMLASLILVGGVLGDQLGRKKVYMTGIVIFLAGSIACGCSISELMLIVCRIIQGVGGALMIPGSLSLISASIDEKDRGRAIGTWSACTTVVTVGGPIIGGALADAGLWRYIFFINVPLGLLALLILWRKVAESKEEGSGHAIDIPGAATIAAALALLTYGCLRMPATGWADGWVLGSLAAGVVLLVVFLQIERRSKEPMMPLSLFQNTVFSAVNALTFFLYAGLGAAMLFLSLNLVQAQGYTQLQAGLTFLPFTALMISLSRYAGRLADRHGPRVLLIAGPATAGVGIWLLSLVGQTSGAADYWTSFFPGMLVFGLGLSMTVTPLTATVMGAVDNNRSGVASGINNALSRIANVSANAIFGALAVWLFSTALRGHLDGVPMTASVRQAVMAQAANLGNAKAPAMMGVKGSAVVAAGYRMAFISVYATVLRISAGLAFLGALMAFLFVKKGKVR